MNIRALRLIDFHRQFSLAGSKPTNILPFLFILCLVKFATMKKKKEEELPLLRPFPFLSPWQAALPAEWSNAAPANGFAMSLRIKKTSRSSSFLSEIFCTRMEVSHRKSAGLLRTAILTNFQWVSIFSCCSTTMTLDFSSSTSFLIARFSSFMSSIAFLI